MSMTIKWYLVKIFEDGTYKTIHEFPILYGSRIVSRAVSKVLLKNDIDLPISKFNELIENGITQYESETLILKSEGEGIQSTPFNLPRVPRLRG